MTVRDFIYESALYPYSRECFEIDKLCAEIGLMEQYIDNYNFTRDYLADINNAGIVLPESYFQDYMSFTEYTSLMEAVEEKKKTLIEKLKAGWDKLVKKVISVLKAIKNKRAKNTSKEEEMLKRLRKIRLTKAEVDILLQSLKWEPKDSGKELPDQPFRKHLKLKYNGSIPIGDKNILENKIAFALSGTVVKYKPGDLLSLYKHAISTNDLTDILKHLSDNSYDADRAMDAIKSAQNYIKKNGIEVNINSDDIGKIITELERLEDMANDGFIKSKDSFKDATLDELPDLTKLNDVYLELKSAAGCMANYYKAVEMSRNIMLGDIQTALDVITSNRKIAANEKILSKMM